MRNQMKRGQGQNERLWRQARDPSIGGGGGAAFGERSLYALLTLAVALAGSVAAAGTAWKADVRAGDWADASNWDGGVPDATTPALIANDGGDYAITVRSDVTLYATNTTIGNASGTTTLCVDSPLTFFTGGSVACRDGFFRQTAGARTVVRAGGVLQFGDGPYAYAGTVSVKESDVIVDGGTFRFAATGDVCVEGSAERPATFAVTNGGAAYHCATVENSDATFKLLSHARLLVHDGTFWIDQPRGFFWTNPFVVRGGEIAVSGTGRFLARSLAGETFQALALNAGHVTVKDDAQFGCGSLLLQPDSDETTLTLSFSGRSQSLDMPQGAYREAYVGDSRGRSVYDWNSSARMKFATAAFVGFNRGIGEMNVRQGAVDGMGNGLYVGSAAVTADLGHLRAWGRNGWEDALVNDPADFLPTGIVRVSGGSLVVRGEYSQDAYGPKRMVGLMVGDGTSDFDSYSNRTCHGRLELSGGAVTNCLGYFGVGLGHAVGRVVQTGGTLYVGDPAWPAYSRNSISSLGLAGGDGAFVLSNGVYEAHERLYVGGATPDDLNLPATVTQFPKAARDSKGVLTLACHDKSRPCALTVGRNLLGVNEDLQGIWVGRDGDGTIEVIGSGSSITTHGLTLTNGFTTADGELLTHGRATLRFVFDADGVGQVSSPDNAVEIAPNARLEIDMTAFGGSHKTLVKVLSCATRRGSFSPANMTLKGCEVIQDRDANIYARTTRRPGAVLVVR